MDIFFVLPWRLLIDFRQAFSQWLLIIEVMAACGWLQAFRDVTLDISLRSSPIHVIFPPFFINRGSRGRVKRRPPDSEVAGSNSVTGREYLSISTFLHAVHDWEPRQESLIVIKILYHSRCKINYCKFDILMSIRVPV